MPLTYPTPTCFDEFVDAEGIPRRDGVATAFNRFSEGDLTARQQAAEQHLRLMGITFAVYGNAAGIEKVWPFDVLPRVIEATEWDRLRRGLQQRIRALNLFIDDLYNDAKIVKDGVVDGDLVYSSKTYREVCKGIHPPGGVWVHITGTDLVRGDDGEFYVLEDNLRCPSGVSYVLGNREVLKRTMPELFRGQSVAPVEDYPEKLLETLQKTAPEGATAPQVAVLTPGIYNSAYFEHSFLAQQMGVELVQGSDLIVENGRVKMHTTRGFQQVDVLYRRIDDDFIDPRRFNPDSVLGVPGLMEVYLNGGVTLANAPGTGIADDKAVYAYVPEIIKYYLSEDAILPNVETYLCADPKQREHVLTNIDQLVVKPVNESGGYGIMLGPRSTKTEREACAAAVRNNPRNYIAQPMLTLSTVPTLIENRLEPRHVDLRPFILHGGDDIYVMPGGLTRVALKAGSMIVNSSQGGGSKDTWVLTE